MMTMVFLCGMNILRLGLDVIMLFTPFLFVQVFVVIDKHHDKQLLINRSFFVLFELFFVIIIITFICTFIPIPTQTQKQYMLVVSITETIQLGKLTILLLHQEQKILLACFLDFSLVQDLLFSSLLLDSILFPKESMLILYG